MEVQVKASKVAHELEQAMATINGRTFAAMQPSRASISTMTITATLNVKRVCRESLMIAMSLVEGSGPLTETAKKSHKRKQATPAVFYNQITVRHGTKSVKVFNNGSIHVTGCTSPTEFLSVASAVCKMMGEVAGIETVDGSAVCVTGFEIQMINMNFGAGKQLYLQGLRDTCASLGYVASYDADVYPGLNIKLPVGDRRVTVLIFRSGKIIITGAKSAADLEEAHRMITEVVAAPDS